MPVKETMRPAFPDITPSPKGLLSFFLPSFLLLLVKESKDVHSYKIRSGPITDVDNGKVGKVQVRQRFFKAKNTESSATKSALDICWGEEAAHLLGTEPLRGSSLHLAPWANQSLPAHCNVFSVPPYGPSVSFMASQSLCCTFIRIHIDCKNINATKT